MIRMRAAVVLLAGICISAASVASSDNLQSLSDQQDFLRTLNPLVFHLKGDSDYRLSGLNLYRATIDDAITLFGTPTYPTHFPKIQESLGGSDYEWRRHGLLMQLHTCHDGKTLCSIEVHGAKPDDNFGMTGNGLKLGSTMADVRRLYFGRFSTAPDDRASQVTLVWSETIMYLYFDDARRINGIVVRRGPCLYLFGCNPPESW